MSEFYVGYLARAPERLGRHVFRIVIALGCLALLLALLLAFHQHPFAASTFEYRQYHDYDGAIVESPYPILVNRQARYLLVAPGKHGASELVTGLNLGNVELRGSLIRRGDDKMLEIVPGSIRTTSGQVKLDERVSLGHVSLTGEIVDSKCYLGVMNPGNGKVHRDCAVRCISGGIPPALIVKDMAGTVRTILLTASDGGALSPEVLDMVAEPVQITGQLFQSGSTLILQAAPNAFVRISE
jgi:hypothetical protein